jgi:CMP/dCMP kinase
MIIAIDGPAASGKSTIAREVAKRLKYSYIDTGAMYRAVTLKALEGRVDITDKPALALLAQRARIELSHDEGGREQVILDDKDVTAAIRTPKVSAAVSAVSKVPGVRRELVKKQRALQARLIDVVAEGRDVGSVVFPEAELKIYLTASVAERARRRHKELIERGYDVKSEAVERDIIARDRVDSTRQVSPLTIVPDAVQVDTTEKTIGEITEEVARLATGRGFGGV